MGGCTFWVTQRGSTAALAFRAAVDEARHEFGHGGYTGTIAEKRDFVVLAVPKGRDAKEYSGSEEALDLVDDKWGPAGCVQIAPNVWAFFGWASS